MSTVNEPAVIDEAAYEVTRTVRIRATRARVWAALTRDDLISQWFGQRASLPDLRVGGEGTFGWDGYGTTAVRIEEYDEPDAFAFTWGAGAGVTSLEPGNSTLARFTLADDGDDTLLTVVEAGFEHLDDPAAHLADHRGGWTDEIDELVAFLEGASLPAGA